MAAAFERRTKHGPKRQEEEVATAVVTLRASRNFPLNTEWRARNVTTTVA